MNWNRCQNLKKDKAPGQDNINSELYKFAPVEFKLRLLQFLNNIYIYIYIERERERENHIPNEWRNAVITPISKKGDRREPHNYRGISILDTFYKIYFKVFDMKLQKYSEVFMTET